MPEKVKIAQLVSKQEMPDKQNAGKTYTMTKVVDDKGREIAGFGVWSQGWKEGDVVEMILQPKEWTNSQGFRSTSYTAKNPNAKKGGFGGSGKTAPSTKWFQSYDIASKLVPFLFAGKAIKLADVDKLAIAIKERIEGKFDPAQPAPVAQQANTVPTVAVGEPTPQATQQPTYTPQPAQVTDEGGDDVEFDDSDPFGEGSPF